MKKRVIVALLTMALLMAGACTAFACDYSSLFKGNSYLSACRLLETFMKDEPSEEVLPVVEEPFAEEEKECDVLTDEIGIPVIKECRYIHQTLNVKDGLSIRFEEVTGASGYEVALSDQNGELLKTYQTVYTSLYLMEGSDEWITSCVRGYQVKVRALDILNDPGDWSEAVVIGCNSVF